MGIFFFPNWAVNKGPGLELPHWAVESTCKDFPVWEIQGLKFTLQYPIPQVKLKLSPTPLCTFAHIGSIWCFWGWGGSPTFECQNLGAVWVRRIGIVPSKRLGFLNFCLPFKIITCLSHHTFCKSTCTLFIFAASLSWHTVLPLSLLPFFLLSFRREILDLGLLTCTGKEVFPRSPPPVWASGSNLLFPVISTMSLFKEWSRNRESGASHELPGVAPHLLYNHSKTSYYSIMKNTATFTWPTSARIHYKQASAKMSRQRKSRL